MHPTAPIIDDQKPVRQSAAPDATHPQRGGATFNYTGTAPDSNVRVLAQILDKTTGKVLGNQITPIPATLDGHSHSASLPLEIVTATATHSSRFVLQLVAQSTIYNAHPQGGSISFFQVKVSLPLVRAGG